MSIGIMCRCGHSAARHRPFGDGKTFCEGDNGEGCGCQKLELPHPASAVDHPQHYGGRGNPYEAIKVIEAWGLDFALGNAVKYVSRAGKKDPSKELGDLEKAAWYLNRRIDQLKKSGA